MIKKITFTLLLFTICINSQNKSINDYKYVIVPSKLNFVKKVDQYQTSSLTKFLLKKNGFNVFLSNEDLPEDLKNNKCLALTTTVIDESNMIVTRNIIQLKDCYDNVVYTSKIGKSKLKDFKKAFHEAIRNAHNSMLGVRQNYKASKTVKKSVKPNIKTTVVKELPKVVTVKKVKKTESKEIKIKKNLINLLYAQPINNGYQVVNTKPEVVFQILKTGVNNVFILKDKNGILYKRDEFWIAEFYDGTTLKIKKYNIKF